MRRLERPAELVATYGPAAYIICLPLELTSVWLHQQLSRFVLGAVVLAFAYLVAARRRSINVPRGLSVLFLVLYVVASVASWMFQRAPGSLNSVADVTLYPLVALLLANLVVAEADHRRAWSAFMASAVLVAALGVVLYFTHLRLWEPNPLVAARLNITFGDPNITARFLTLGACAAILMYAERQGPSWLAIATAAACGAVLPLTLSRSGLALFIGTALFAVLVALHHRRAAAIAAIALAVFFVSTAVNADTRQRAEDAAASAVSIVIGHPFSFGASGGGAVHPQNTAEDNRKYLVAAGLAMFRDHPAIGVGFGGYQNALLTSYRSYLPGDRTGPNLDTISHAAIVTVLAEQGVAGTVLFLAFLIALGWEAWRARRRGDDYSRWAVIPAASIVPIFLYSQFEGRFFSEPYFWLAVGLLYSAMSARRRAVVAREPAPRVRRVEVA